MAFDGIVIANIVQELKDKLVGGRVVKISQPEKDELIFTVKNYDQYRLFMSADASLPLIYLSDSKKEAPLNSPAFCMLLRKHLGSARILDVSQPDFERIIYIDFEHLNELGDICRKRLIIEIMGKHSNIIFCDDEGRILDSIKRVPVSVSSVREVLPGRDYFITRTVEKFDPMKVDESAFRDIITRSAETVSKAVYCGLTGISPQSASELVFRAGFEPDIRCGELSPDMVTHLFKTFERMMEDIRGGAFFPSIVYIDGAPRDFSAVRLTCLMSTEGAAEKSFESISAALEEFYRARNSFTRIRQKSADLRHVVMLAIERESKKYDLQLKQLEDTAKRDKYKLYGELLTTYGYGLESGLDSAVLSNYYTGEDITVPLDKDKSPIDNAKAYYDRYSKLKRTFEALSKLTVETKEALDHLQSIRLALDIAEHESDLDEIRQELTQFGYIKGHPVRDRDSKPKKGKGSGRIVSTPFHYVTQDGFHIYVGRNNFQNDELTFKFAEGSDWWFHAKGIPGSHVILKTAGREIPDRVFEQAAALAAHYSSAGDSEKVEVDYLEKKNVKKPNAAKPGFVVYYTNYSMVAVPGLEGLEEI